MHEFLKPYGFGRFAVLMMVAGLNDYQLKGRAEVAYWPPLRNLLRKSPVPASPSDMEEMLSKFYSRERYYETKLRRMRKFLSSRLAEEIWRSDPKSVADNFVEIWFRLAETMNQKREAKTITFSMKCLGISLLMAGESNFSFEKIPIPVDYRVREFTKRLGVGVKDDDDVRRFWNLVLDDLRRAVDINMIHLDSLIWQIGVLRKHEIVEYFSRLGLKELGEKIAEVVE